MRVKVDLAALERNFAALERNFAAHAKNYSAQKAISYQAWREFGVPAAALKAAGIGRS